MSGHTKQLICLGLFTGTHTHTHTHTHTTIDTLQIVYHFICGFKILLFDVNVELRVHSLTKSCITLVERTEVVH